MAPSLTERINHQWWSARRRIRDRVLDGRADVKTVREDVAARYLRGSGIEIGALNFPLHLGPGVDVRYVDYLPSETLREHHAHLIAEGQRLVEPDVVDNGEQLGSFADGSLDFVVANHFIEHTEDPIGALESHARVLRPNGVLYMAVPDKRRTFDRDRPVTSLDHVVRDHREGPEGSRADHYLEWALLVDKVPEEDARAYAADLASRPFSIHFHVWTPPAFLELLLHCVATGLALDIELAQQNGEEFLTVLRKTSPAALAS